jgi:hypothetical protein
MADGCLKELTMRTRKWIGLLVAGGMLLQVGTCTTDFLYMVMQGLATQIASGIVNQVVGTTTGTM